VSKASRHREISQGKARIARVDGIHAALRMVLYTGIPTTSRSALARHNAVARAAYTRPPGPAFGISERQLDRWRPCGARRGRAVPREKLALARDSMRLDGRIGRFGRRVPRRAVCVAGCAARSLNQRASERHALSLSGARPPSRSRWLSDSPHVLTGRGGTTTGRNGCGAPAVRRSARSGPGDAAPASRRLGVLVDRAGRVAGRVSLGHRRTGRTARCPRARYARPPRTRGDVDRRAPRSFPYGYCLRIQQLRLCAAYVSCRPVLSLAAQSFRTVPLSYAFSGFVSH